jgi:hypothetical protein
MPAITHGRMIVAATLAAAFVTGPALGASKDEDVTVKLKVNPMVQLRVTDSTLDMEASDITEEDLDATGKTVAAGRATFWVTANTTYDINLAPEETWGDAGDLQVKFVGTDDPDVYIGGTLFLDTDISSDDPSEDGSDIEDWDGDNGDVSYSASSRGVARYGIGAIFNPQKWSGNGDEDDGNAPSGMESIAPPDDYVATVTITVSSN